MGTAMDAGMNQWLMWGGVGLAVLLILFGITALLYRGKKRIATAGTADNIAGDTMAESSQEAGSASLHTDVNTKGWGFWPWALLSLLLMAALAWLVWTSWGMNGMSAIKWIFWSLLGLGALFATMGFFQMIRRHPLVDEKRGSPRGLGFMTMITGLVLAGASWFVWQPKIARLGELPDKISGYQEHIRDYQSQLTGYKKKVSGFEDQTTKLSAENARLGGIIAGLKDKLAANTANLDEISRLNGVVKGLTADNGDLQDENKRLKERLNSSTANGEEVERLQSVIAGLNKDIEHKDSEIARLERLVSANGTDNDEIARLNSKINSLEKEKSDLITENTRMNGLIGKYKNDSEVQGAKIAALQDENEKLRNKPPVVKTVTVPAPVAGQAAPLTALQLLRQHGKKNPYLNLVNKDYRMNKIREKKLINGKTGKYYRISLKSPGGKGYRFASGKYNKITPSAPFKASLDRVIEDIRNALDGRRTYQIYVRGKASAGRFKGRMDKTNAYHDVELLERGENGKYTDQPKIRHYGNKLTNDDLPNLRGAYLADYLAKHYDGINPVILDGKVSRSKNTAKQSVDIILYVEE